MPEELAYNGKILNVNLEQRGDHARGHPRADVQGLPGRLRPGRASALRPHPAGGRPHGPRQRPGLDARRDDRHADLRQPLPGGLQEPLDRRLGRRQLRRRLRPLPEVRRLGRHPAVRRSPRHAGLHPDRRRRGQPPRRVGLLGHGRDQRREEVQGGVRQEDLRGADRAVGREPLVPGGHLQRARPPGGALGRGRRDGLEAGQGRRRQVDAADDPAARQGSAGPDEGLDEQLRGAACGTSSAASARPASRPCSALSGDSPVRNWGGVGIEVFSDVDGLQGPRRQREDGAPLRLLALPPGLRRRERGVGQPGVPVPAAHAPARSTRRWRRSGR